jgi:DNA processing protein
MPGPPIPDDLRDHLRLALTPDLGPRRTAALLQAFGSPTNIFAATANGLRSVPGIGDKLAGQLAASFRTIDVQREWDAMQAAGVWVVPLGHPDYPQRLATIPDPPPLLYLKGTLTAEDDLAVGVVGSRSCTNYGLKAADAISGGLARAGWTVVSGLARGIDGSAHKGALAAGGRTIAVLAGGLGRIYPPEHTELAEQVAAKGCLITETPMTVAPQPGMFPARNRIISGLSRGVLVVEANIKSGALITVEHAAEQGREVFALPGPIDSPASAGCLDLIRKGGRLVRSAADVIEDLLGIAPPDPPKPRTNVPVTVTVTVTAPPRPPLSAEEDAVWQALAEPRLQDELARSTGLAVGDLMRVLMQLEFKRVVRRLPGSRYERV